MTLYALKDELVKIVESYRAHILLIQDGITIVERYAEESAAQFKKEGPI